VTDGIPENVPGPNFRAVEITTKTLAGNHVIERLGDGIYATFAHMQPGSLRVKLGDHVHRGQLLGLVGNSGNSTGPHLHFQLCDANSVIHCDGIPYAIRTFQSQGRWKVEGTPVTRTEELPTDGEIVTFAPDK